MENQTIHNFIEQILLVYKKKAKAIIIKNIIQKKTAALIINTSDNIIDLKKKQVH